MSKALLMDNVIKGLKEYISKRAEQLAENDDDAGVYISEQQNANDDVGGFWEYEDLPNHVQDRLEQEVKDEILDGLENVFGDDSEIFATFEYIVENMK